MDDDDGDSGDDDGDDSDGDTDDDGGDDDDYDEEYDRKKSMIASYEHLSLQVVTWINISGPVHQGTTSASTSLP